MYSYLYIILGNTSIGNWMFDIVVLVQLLLSSEVSIFVGSPCGVMAKLLDCSHEVSLNSSLTITFTFRKA